MHLMLSLNLTGCPSVFVWLLNSPSVCGSCLILKNWLACVSRKVCCAFVTQPLGWHTYPVCRYFLPCGQVFLSVQSLCRSPEMSVQIRETCSIAENFLVKIKNCQRQSIKKFLFCPAQLSHHVIRRHGSPARPSAVSSMNASKLLPVSSHPLFASASVHM